MHIQTNSDVLFINVPLDRTLDRRKEYCGTASMPPIGILYIIAVLELNGYRVSFIDLAIEAFDKEDFINYLKEIQPKIVGMSTYAESWKIQNALAKNIKNFIKDSVMVAGGYCATFSYQEILKETEFDYVIRSEGEFSFLALCDCLIRNKGTIREVKNLAYLENGKLFINETERIMDLDALPFPERRVLNLSKYSYPFTISTARGCPGRCIFCSANAFWGNKVILRSPQSVIAEIREMHLKHGMKSFFIVDDTFTIKPSRTIEFCELMQDLCKELNTDFSWGCESRVDVIKSEDKMLKLMKQAGCKMVQFGMESGNDEVLKSIKKNVTYAQIYNAAQKAYEANLKMNISFMIGHHTDTMETIKETITKAVDLKNKFKANMVFSINTPYPGTELRNHLDELGVELIVKDLSKLRMNDSAINTLHLTSNDIKRGYGMATDSLT